LNFRWGWPAVARTEGNGESGYRSRAGSGHVRFAGGGGDKISAGVMNYIARFFSGGRGRCVTKTFFAFRSGDNWGNKIIVSHGGFKKGWGRPGGKQWEFGGIV